MLDVSGITKCRAYGIRAAVDFISRRGTKSVSLKEIQSNLRLTNNQMYSIRREINKQNELETGRLKYLFPRDERLVIHIPENEEYPNIIMAVEAAIINLSLDKSNEKEIKKSLTKFLKEQLNEKSTT